MAINKNHEFEDLNGIKCAIVEKNVSTERVSFLKQLLELNKYTVVVVPSPPPKAAAPVAKPAADDASQPVVPAAEPKVDIPETFTVGVTNVSFNATNAIFGRLLHTRSGHVVTLAYWQQKDKQSHDEIPYFEELK